MRWVIWLLVFLFVSAGRAEARPKRAAPGVTAPKVAAPLQVPINSQVIGPDGTVYLLTGTLSLTVTPPAPAPVPSPAPSPDPLSIVALTVNPSSVLQGAGSTGTVTLNRSPLAAVQIPITVLDKGITVVSPVTIQPGQTSGTFAIGTSTAPNVTFWYSLVAAYNGQSRLVSMLVRAVPVPVPVPGPAPVVTGITQGDGSPIPATGIVVGSTVAIQGTSFGLEVNGTQIGHVRWNGLEWGKISWSDTRIVAHIEPGAGGTGTVAVVRADGQTAVGPSFVVIGLPSGIVPSIRRVTDAAGGPIPEIPAYGETLWVWGERMGNGAGSLFINGYPTPPLSWTDTAASWLAEDAMRALPRTVTVRRADGGEYSTLLGPDGAGPDGTGPVPEPAPLPAAGKSGGIKHEARHD